ncbi:MAG: hypothetical protein KAS13_04815 [Candidatus Omnitrophica bacterium]|nr:hypothetical protein [Candidatus Omnitrophota bacterium]
MDQEKFIFLLRCLAVLVVILLFFTFVVPKYKQLNKFIDEKVEEFVSLIFETSSAVRDKSANIGKGYTQSELALAVDSFSKKFMSFNKTIELKRLINTSKSILQLIPLNLNIRQKHAFLFYMDAQYEKAIENYEFILENVPKRRRTFKKLRDNPDYNSVKRALLELAALHYDIDEKELMIDYYKQFLRLAFRYEVYCEYISGGINEKNVRFGIFSNFSGAGFFSYKKSIDELEKYLIEYPEEKEVIVDLGRNNFEVVNLFFDNSPSDYLNYLNNAQKYLKLNLIFASERRKTEINNDLAQIVRLEGEYVEKNQTGESPK